LIFSVFGMENQILVVSKRHNPPPKAPDVRLTWARARTYKDRLAYYSKQPHLVPNRILEIARHYGTTSLTAFACVFSIITSGAMTTVPFDLARAGDCLAAPNFPAPKGSHWYYHLNRETQQKCWYVRSSEKQPQHATVRTTSTAAAVPSTRAEPISSAVTSGLDSPSSQLEPSTNAAQDPASNTVANTLASAPQENIQPSAPRGNALSAASGPVTATTAAVRPDPPPMAPSVSETNAAAAIMNPVSDTVDSVGGNGEQASKYEIPIAVFPALAIGLLAIGFGIRFIMKDSHPRRAPTVDYTGAITISDDDRLKVAQNRPADGSTILKEDDFQLFVSAISDHAPPESTISSVQLTNAISRREAKLARLRDDIDRCLGWAEPTHGNSLNQKLAC
jgi:hypothetical protein